MKSKLITLFLLLVTIGSITSAQGIKEEISLKYGATNEGSDRILQCKNSG